MHRIKVVDADGNWVWKRFGEIAEGDRVPLMLNGMVGDPQHVDLPPLGELYWTSDSRHACAAHDDARTGGARRLLHGRRLPARQGAALLRRREDQDVVEHLVDLDCRALRPRRRRVRRSRATPRSSFNSVPLTLWWEACGFAKLPPAPSTAARAGCRTSRTPSCTRTTATSTRPSSADCSRPTARQTTATSRGARPARPSAATCRALMLALGFVTTRKVDCARARTGAITIASSSGSLNVAVRRALPRGDRLHLRAQGGALWNGDHRAGRAARPHPGQPGAARRAGARERPAAQDDADGARPPRRRLSPVGDALLERTADPELEHLLGFYYDTVATVEMLDDQPTYDISVPDNVTYVANGFVSHNTISFMMDCDTTGVEPDFSLVKSKKLVGGGEITIVNKTVPMALDKLGYAPRRDRGDRRVHRRAQHDRRRAAREERALPDLRLRHRRAGDPLHGPREDDGRGPAVHLGRDLEDGEPAGDDVGRRRGAAADRGVAAGREGDRDLPRQLQDRRSRCPAKDSRRAGRRRVAASTPRQRRRLPDDRTEVGRKFKVGEYEGYIHVGLFEDGTPGDIFVDIAKEGTTLAGLMNSFMISVSLGLQYGVPLEVYVSKFAHMRFEPCGPTNDADIRIAKSIVDYIFRWMGKKFLTPDQQEEAGILTPEVKARLAAAYAGGRGAPRGPALSRRRRSPPARPRCSTAGRTRSSAPSAAAAWCGPAAATRAATAGRTPAAAD